MSSTELLICRQDTSRRRIQLLSLFKSYFLSSLLLSSLFLTSLCLSSFFYRLSLYLHMDVILSSFWFLLSSFLPSFCSVLPPFFSYIFCFWSSSISLTSLSLFRFPLYFLIFFSFLFPLWRYLFLLSGAFLSPFLTLLSPKNPARSHSAFPALPALFVINVVAFVRYGSLRSPFSWSRESDKETEREREREREREMAWQIFVANFDEWFGDGRLFSASLCQFGEKRGSSFSPTWKEAKAISDDDDDDDDNNNNVLSSSMFGVVDVIVI